MKAVLLAPVAAMVVGILTAPSVPAYPAMCPPGTLPKAGGPASAPWVCVPNPAYTDPSGCHIDKYGAHLICPGPRTCGPFGCTDGSPSPG
jgi:hypothetical protein